MNRKAFELTVVLTWLAGCGVESVPDAIDVEEPSSVVETPQPSVPRIEKAAGLAILIEDAGEANAFAFFHQGENAASYKDFPEGLVPSGKCAEGRHNFSLEGPYPGSVPTSVGPSVDFKVGNQTLQAGTDYYSTSNGAMVYGLRATGVDPRGKFGLSFGQATASAFNADFFEMPRAASIERRSLNEAQARENPLKNLSIRWTATEGDFVLVTFAKPSSSNFDEVDKKSPAVLTCIVRNTGEFSPPESRALNNAFSDYEYINGRRVYRLFVSVQTFKVGKAVWKTEEPSDASENHPYDLKVISAAGVTSRWEPLTQFIY